MKHITLSVLLTLSIAASAQNTIFDSPSNGYPGTNSPSPSNVGVAVPGSTGETTSYDSRSGNSYNSMGSGYQGHNSNTGSTWSAQTYGGITTGTDSHGNSWSYDRSTGAYQNYGTGETRIHGQSNR